MKRAQMQWILKDLEKKIVIIVGPRQTGKTWLAKEIAKQFRSPTYLNYEQVLDKKIFHDQSWLPSTDLLILDELHKMDQWKNYLKGVYDTKPESMRIIVTGSARLDIYSQLGDSLAGRYFRHRLLPLSLAELHQIGQTADLDRLLERSGFPEPYLADDLTTANRWRLQYADSILNTDIFEFDKIQNMKAMQLVFKLLQNRVGTPISMQSLANDIAVSPTTIKKYIQVLEALFIVFRVTPYSKNIARSLLKEPKIYFFDTGLVQGDDDAKLENFVASSLLKHVYAKTDYHAEEHALHYLRTKDGREVDFAIANAGTIEQILEVKSANDTISQTLLYYHQKYGYPAVQLVKTLRREYTHEGIQVRTVENFLKELFL